jgi:hypothetical protein
MNNPSELDKAVKKTPKRREINTSPAKEDIRKLALRALLEVADDPVAPSAARAAAARTLLESLGDIGRLQEVAQRAEKPLNEMSPREINEELDRLRPRK